MGREGARAYRCGWRLNGDKVGQTGARIARELFSACGTSGAVQHIAGCQAAKRIPVMNKDPNAPIVGRADYAIVDDPHKIVPALIAEVRGAR